MDQALAAMHQANSRRLPICLEIRRHEGQVTLACRFPEALRGTVEGQLFAQYPECRISPLLDKVEEWGASKASWELALHLHQSLFPIKRYPQFEDALNRVSSDPLTALFMAISGDREPSSLEGRIEIVIRPVSRWVRRRALKCLQRLAGPFFRRHHQFAHLYAAWAMSPHRTMRLFGWLLGRLEREPDHSRGTLTTSAARQHDREEDLQAAADKLGRLLFEVEIRLCVTGRPEDEAEAKSKLRDMAGAFGQFSSPRLAYFRAGRRAHGPALLSTEEVATLWHPATATVRAPTMTAVESRELPPPVQLPTRQRDRDIAILGVTAYRGQRERFGILPEDRRRHVAIVGKTGMGKSTLLRHLIASDIAAGRGAGLIDPHGDLCEAIVAAIPSYRTNDIILFDAGDTAFPLAFNILSCPRPEQRHLVAEGVVSAFKKLYANFWGARMGYFLHSAILALLEVPDTTLLSLQRFLSDRRYRDAILNRVKDPVVRSIWQQEFAAMAPKFQAEVVAPIQNKIGAFTSNPLLRNIIGQPRSTFDLRTVMDEGKVLLCNLSKGRTGDDASSLLGSFLVTAIQLAAMSRADIPEERRRDFFLYVDEFQNLATESFATILSEARKYRVALTLSHQYLAQVEEQTLSAVFGNVGTLVAFQVGAHDSEILAEQLGGELTAQDLLTVPRYQAYARLLIDGHPSRPFSLTTLPPPRSSDRHRPEIVRRTSRQRYGRPEARVEKEVLLSFA